MRGINSIMGEIRTEAAEIGLTEKLEKREQERGARVEKVIAEHASRANEIGLGRATRELAVALQRSEEGHDEATLALGRYRAFVAELLESGPLAISVSARVGGRRWHCLGCSNTSIDSADSIKHTSHCLRERARKALEGRPT